MSDALRIMDVLRFLIEKGPGRTEAQLAEALFGGSAHQQRVNQDCRLLEVLGKVERRGSGGLADPFTYHPKVAAGR
jgi:hypothetical protein